MTGKQSSLRAYGAQKSAVVGGGERGESTADVAIVQAGGGIGGSEKAREVTAGCGGGSEIRFFFLFFPASMVPINIRCVRCTRPQRRECRTKRDGGWRGLGENAGNAGKMVREGEGSCLVQTAKR